MRFEIRHFIVSMALMISGCVTTPAPFEIGDEAPPPAGCIEGRTRGVDC